MPSSLLIVALGGGGDSITAHLLASHFLQKGMTVSVASLAWERFIKDPLPGPRRCVELSALKSVGKNVGEVMPATAFPSGELINQAVLVQADPRIQHFILNPHEGVTGLVAALHDLRKYLGTPQLMAVDIGGDVLATEPLPTLSSPLADAMLASAIYQIDPATRVYIGGLGLDGEIPLERLNSAIQEHQQAGYIIDTHLADLSLVTPLTDLLDKRLLDTEMTALYLRAHQGMRGQVLVRDAGCIVTVGAESRRCYIYPAAAIYEHINPLPKALHATRSILEASDFIESLGFSSEFTYETKKHASSTHRYPDMDETLLAKQILSLLPELRSGAIDYVAERHLSERLKASIASVRKVTSQLAAKDQIRLTPPFVPLH